MTKEEAIKAAKKTTIKLVKEVAGMSLDWDDAHYDALQMAIKALEQEPCVVNIKDLSDDEMIKKFEEIMKKATVQVIPKEPCEDAVSRQALYEALYERFHDEDAPNNITEVRLGAVRNFVKDFPLVTPTRKKGKWIHRKAKYDNAVPVYECSICHKYNGFEDTNYCPNCGCKMRSE